jgi:hypothetical protein
MASLSRPLNLTRRNWIKLGFTAVPACRLHGAEPEASARDGAKRAHAELWRRFIDKQGIMIDFADLDGSVSLPTPAECREGKPNALGWWSPIENGAMFNGLFMDAAVNRWRHTRAEADAAKARKLMRGLLHLNEISDIAGFVGRGVSTDGRSHYAMGSNDQSFPWFLGLWRYVESGLATEQEREQIAARMAKTAEIIVRLKWQMPAEAPYGVRGGFGSLSFEGAPRLLFVCKMLHGLTKDAQWDARYREALKQGGGVENRTRLEYCRQGMRFEGGHKPSWTSCNSVAALRGLWELEEDAQLKQAYAAGLEASAILAMESLPLADGFENADTSHFEMDWRQMNALWHPQADETEAQKLAEAQLRDFRKACPRRWKETDFVREPTAAAWIVTLAPDRQMLKNRAPAVRKVIGHYDYAKLYYSQFFWVESAWWRIADLG